MLNIGKHTQCRKITMLHWPWMLHAEPLEKVTRLYVFLAGMEIYNQKQVDTTVMKNSKSRRLNENMRISFCCSVFIIHVSMACLDDSWDWMDLLKTWATLRLILSPELPIESRYKWVFNSYMQDFWVPRYRARYERRKLFGDKWLYTLSAQLDTFDIRFC